MELLLPFCDAYLPVVDELAALNDDPARVRPFLSDCLFCEAERIGAEVFVEFRLGGGVNRGEVVVVLALLDPELAVRENPLLERRFLHHDEFMVDAE